MSLTGHLCVHNCLHVDHACGHPALALFLNTPTLHVLPRLPSWEFCGGEIAVPNGTLPSAVIGVAQPVTSWRKLPRLKSGSKPAGQDSRRGSSHDEHHNDKHSPAETVTDLGAHAETSNTPHANPKPQESVGSRKASMVVAAGFVASPSGLCCCIAVAEPDPWPHKWAHLQTLIQPVSSENFAALNAPWQKAVLPLASHEGRPAADNSLLTCRACTPVLYLY